MEKHKKSFIQINSIFIFCFAALFSPISMAANATDIRNALEQELAELDAIIAAEEEVYTPSPEINIARESYDNPLIQIETSVGAIILELFPREAPVAVKNFIDLAEGNKAFTDPVTGLQVIRPFYDGLLFHRVIDEFMVQGGSPTGLGDGGPGFQFNDEINARNLGFDRMKVINQDGIPLPLLGIQNQQDFQNKILIPLYADMGINNQAELDLNVDAVNDRLNAMTVKQSYENLGYEYTERVLSRPLVSGVIAMANSGPNSNGSQFFITLADTPWLTGKHTVFGKVRSGFEVLESIGNSPVNADSRPYQDITITSIRQLE